MTATNEPSGIHYGYQPDGKNAYTLYTRPASSQLKVVVDDLTRLQSGRVLNLGCGDGILENLLPIDRKFTTVSIDRDSYAIAHLQRILTSQGRNNNDTALVDDIIQLPTLDSDTKKFDRVISWRVLHGINPEYYQSFLQKIHDRMTVGGIFHLSAASDLDWKAKKLKELNKFDDNGMNNCKEIMFDNYDVNRRDNFYVHFMTLKEIERLAKEARFKILLHNYFQEPSGYSHLNQYQNSYIYVQLEAL